MIRQLNAADAMDKRALRRWIGEQKCAMTEAQADAASGQLAAMLFATEAYTAARSIYATLSFNREVRTRPIIEHAWADGKRVAVPKVFGREMRFIWLDDLDRLEISAFGVPEPVSDAPVADDDTALVLVPGLAFDARGHRVGYGGGYYDRWLSAHPGHPTVALGYGFQRVENIDAEEHDVPVDLVLFSDLV